ncbi:MAG: CDP-glycerol glycerophosphotransferase family protein [Ruminiclostridium sp.]|nr:CDP-glycerol glycerophosphotransferase family protein [Ruminiclostridium sp.]
MERFLEKYDYTLDFKLHPIFSCYKQYFEIKNNRVRIVDTGEKIEQYEKFVTDFSSFMFDFLYLDRQLYSFIPDGMQFRCGMNSYREIEEESEKIFIKICDKKDLEIIFNWPQIKNTIKFLIDK